MTETPQLKLASRIPALHRANDLAAGFRQELDGLKRDVSRLGRADSRLNSSDYGLQGVLDGMAFGGAGYGNQDMSAQPYTLANANSYVPISLNRILLNYSYMTQGLIRTVIDQPVEDAFRGGVKFKSGELDEDDLKELNRAFKRKRGRRAVANGPLSRATRNSGYNQANSDLDAIKQTVKWSRLFGGSGLIVNTDQSFGAELNVEAIGEDSPLEFIAADRWELLLQSTNIFAESMATPYNYYGLALNRSRVVRMLGPEAPSFIRQRLQGWGMSVLEDSIRAINTYLKFEKLLFELLDEAKIDVYKIKGFNSALASSAGTAAVQRRVQLANQLKNFQSALSMDTEDDYQQKQLTFSGIADIYEQCRINLCAYMRIPYNKVFGQSAGGFSSGTDAIENYNSTVGNIRENAEPLVMEAGELRCQNLFGFVPEDLEAEFSPLDVMDGTEQEAVATSKQARALALFTAGLLDGQETSEVLDKQSLLLVESDVLKGLREPEPPLSQNPDEVASQQEHDVAMVKAKPAAKPGASGG